MSKSDALWFVLITLPLSLVAAYVDKRWPQVFLPVLIFCLSFILLFGLARLKRGGPRNNGPR